MHLRPKRTAKDGKEVDLPAVLADMPISMQILSELRATILASVLAVAMVLAATMTNFDVIRLDPKLLSGLTKHGVDDLLVGFMLILVGLTIDLWYRRRRRKSELAAQKLQTLQATMRTVQDIVNNFLNNLLLFEMEAKDELPPHIWGDLHTMTRQTCDRLTALGDVESVREKSLGIGDGIEYPEPPSCGLAAIADSCVAPRPQPIACDVVRPIARSA